MKTKLYLHSTFTDIKHSLGRFIAVILIILMGTLLFVGIKSVGPNLEATVTQYIKKQKLSDLQVIGTSGLTQTDQKIAEKVAGAQVELGYSVPYTDKKNSLDLQLYSYDRSSRQNQLTLTSGQWPKGTKEILLDTQLKNKYKLNQTVMLKSDQLKGQRFKVVGFVDSPLYVDKTERGATTVGDGELDGFVYLPKNNFSAEAYSIMYIRFKDLVQTDFFSDAYQTKLTKKENRLTELLKPRKKERQQEITNQATAELQSQATKLQQGQSQLTAGQTQLDQAKVQLDQQKLAAQQAGTIPPELAAAEERLAKQQQALTEQQQQLTTSQRKLDQAKTDLANRAQPNYLINERKSNPGFNEFTSLSDRIDAIGNVFPVFFFLIAILITFTTITRMIEENRKEIGTLKSLGYRNSEISSKYLLYVLLTALIGTTLGVVSGTKLLPPVVFTMLKGTYNFTQYPTHFWPIPILIAIGAALIATLGSSAYVLAKDLREKPTTLLLPKVPKAGKRVLLERVTPIWNRLNFNQKVTYRNLLRYKARMFLTVLGIAGCTGLMVAGFGLKASISGASDKQFTELNHYQAIVSLNDETNTDQATQAKQVIRKYSGIKGYHAVYSDQVKFKQTAVSDQTASLFAFKDTEHINDYVTFNQKSKGKVSLPSSGALISTGLAQAYDVKAGDQLTFQTSTGQNYQLKVAGIIENYLGHNVYLSMDYLQHIMKKTVSENTYLLKTDQLTNAKEKRLAKKLTATDEVTNTTFISDQMEKQASASTNLQPVVLIFIVLSATLAFVVLYNLTNINISERERELATIKVLGFFNQEVTMYIVRENVIFTILGILFGFGIGKLLTWFIITMAGSDLIRFPLIIPPVGYLVSAGLTILFSGIVMGITHIKLKRIDMIGALKSNE